MTWNGPYLNSIVLSRSRSFTGVGFKVYDRAKVDGRAKLDGGAKVDVLESSTIGLWPVMGQSGWSFG